MALSQKLYGIFLGICDAARLNSQMLFDRLCGRKVLVFHVNAAAQFMHIEPVLQELASRQHGHISVYLLTTAAETRGIKSCVAQLTLPITIGLDKASRLLLFCDFFLTVDQGMVFPMLGCKTRACCFHGQPSKGNVYLRYNYKQINTLFFYGPLMRDYYCRAKAAQPGWPEVRSHNVGQPLSDRLFNARQDKAHARSKLGLDPDRFTIIYAPSFEYCSSLATDGRTIVEALLELDINLVVKPHPGFYIAGKFNDDFNRHAPNVASWRELIEKFDAYANCVFTADNSVDAATAFSAADVMLTDYSGVAFDGIQFDMGMIYWDCPLFYQEYLPARYGVDGKNALEDLACNVGREAGILAKDVTELRAAIRLYQKDLKYLAEERMQIRGQLLFNPGRAAAAMTDKILEILVETSR